MALELIVAIGSSVRTHAGQTRHGKTGCCCSSNVLQKTRQTAETRRNYSSFQSGRINGRSRKLKPATNRWRKELCRVDETSTPTAGTVVPVIVSGKKQNAKLRLEVAEACCESPVLLRPFEGTRICCWAAPMNVQSSLATRSAGKLSDLAHRLPERGVQLTS